MYAKNDETAPFDIIMSKSMKRALKNYRVKGVKTSIPFELAVMDCPEFIDGSFDTGFIENNFDFEILQGMKEEYREVVAAIAAYSYRMISEKRIPTLGKVKVSKWKLAGRVTRGR